jgi:hypothetical protein
LPKGYDDHPDVYYPVNYEQGHFFESASDLYEGRAGVPYDFMTEDTGVASPWADESGYDFYKFWISDECPRMIVVTFQDPCHYYDTGYGVNSPNTGPYGDAIMKELIPAVEEKFRIIQKPYARILCGGSTGGWESLALQIFHPDFFGGAFSLCPDPIDFRYFQAVNIYEDKNAFYKEFGWIKVPTPSDRMTDGIVTLTSKQRNHMDLVMGNKCRSGEPVDMFMALYGPVGKDGYVKPLINKRTGEIDPKVAEYWKENWDLRHILEKNWPELGPKLVGKIHIYTGDMDTYYLNNAVRLMEEFLESTKDPYYAGSVTYWDGAPHILKPWGSKMIKLIADHITKSAPKGEDPSKWKY